MENARNKTQDYVINKHKSKNYFDRFTKMNIYSYTKDNKVYLGGKPAEIYSLFNGNTSGNKNKIKNNDNIPDEIVDQSTLQYYIILGIQDFYYNYYLPLEEKNKSLKEEIKMLHTMMKNSKKKNDERYDVLTKNLETLGKFVNNIKK